MYPVELDLRGQPVLVVGGGLAAARQARACLQAAARLLVLAVDGCEDLAALADSGELRWQRRPATREDVRAARLVHAATGSASDDAEVAGWCREAGVWCLVDSPTVPGSAFPAGRGRRPAGDGVGRVTLIGGGPGDPGLITSRGLALLHEADVVVVDRLAPRELLADLDPDVQIIDVGKTPDHHPVPQNEIHRLLVSHARAGLRVARLKGGDPYLLGRGGEEVEACRAAGVPVTVVPGVTSALAVPAAAGIPVTHRGLARSVTVLTGHDDPDHAALVRLGGTIVVLMGVARLPGLCAGLLEHGMDPATPVAVIERGWSARQRSTLARLDDAAAVSAERGVRSPAVIVIGPVAALAADPDRPQTGRRPENTG